MKKIAATGCFLLLACLGFAQAMPAEWKVNMEIRKVFIENRSQFNGRNKVPGTDILFATPDAPSQIFFTKNGLTYSFHKPEPRIKKGDEEREHERKKNADGTERKLTDKERIEREREESQVTVKTDQVQMQWENSNPGVQVVASEITPDYFSYGGSNPVDHARAYQKLVYKGLYPNIDVEYVFHPKGGIEYTFILHPGADISQVKMKYSDVSNVTTDQEGNIHLPTRFGDIIDHAPSSYYANNVKASITSRFVKTGKSISFELGDYDKTKTVVIDPWTFTPSMPTQNKAFDIQTDTLGNVYAYGGDAPQRLLKFNSTGSLLWTFNSAWTISTNTYWTGTLITGPDGVSYVTSGSLGEIAKVTTAGGQVWLDNGSGMREYWSLAFNCDYSVLMIGGENGGGDAMKVNLANGSVTSTLHVANFTPGFLITNPDEIRGLCHSPNGNYYFLVFDSLGSFTPGMTLNWRGSSGYKIGYAGAGYGGLTNQGIHAIAASSNFIYTMNGATLDKRNISNGAILTSVTIPGGVTSTGFGFTTAGNGGIDIDSCGNVYVGSVNQVVKYDANLVQLSTAATAGAVYDVSVGRNGVVVACGDNFVASLSMSPCSRVQPICFTTFSANASPVNPLCGGQCTGSATAGNINGSGAVSYHWSNNANTQTISNLCPGTYTVTATDASSNTATASVTITSPAAFTATASATNTTCGHLNGSATTTVTAGTGPYTYTWSNSANTQTISNVASGTYTVTAIGAGGCSATASATVASSSGVVISTSSTNSGCASTGSATASITSGSGPFTYSWSSGANTQTASNLAAGPYTVTVTGSGGCSATGSVTVNSSGSGITLSSSSTNAGCGISNGSASTSVSAGTGPFTYHWSTGGNTSTISGLASGTYSVTVTGSGGCSATASVTVTGATGITLSSGSTNASCNSNNGSATINATSGTGPYTYSWSNGGNTSTISNVAGGSYSVTVTGSGGCSATASVTVTTTSGITLSSNSTPASCNSNSGSASISTTAGTGPFTYSWSNGGNTATISNVAGGTYSVTVTGAGGCSATANITVTSSNGVSLSAAAVNTTCGASNGSASTSVVSGTGPYTYLWSNGGNTASITNLPSGTYTVTVTGAGGCTATASATVGGSGGGPVTITSDKTVMCSTDSARICAPAGYASYQWNTGAVTQCIYTKLAGNYYVTVTDNGGCTAASNHLAINVHPQPPVSISVNGDSLLSYNALSYQWYLNGVLITGATSPLYIVTQSGYYTVLVSDANGCTALSLPVLVTITGITELVNEGIKVYPNPLSEGKWTLECGADLIGNPVEIFDAEGRLVYKAEIKNQRSEIDLNVARGQYLMKVSVGNKSVAVRLIKL